MSVSSIDLTWFQWRLSNSFILTKALKLQGWDNTMSISSKHLGALDKILTQTHCYQVLSNYYSWKCCVNIMYCVCLVFSVDFVMVCTPHHTHEGIVIAALEAGTTWVHCDIIFKKRDSMSTLWHNILWKSCSLCFWLQIKTLNIVWLGFCILSEELYSKHRRKVSCTWFNEMRYVYTNDDVGYQNISLSLSNSPMF